MISKIFKIKGLAIAMVLAALMSVTAVAQNVSKTLVVSRDAKIAGVVLSQGRYSIEFDGKKEGEAVITRNGREVVKAPYKLVDLAKDAADNAVVFSVSGDGSFQVKRFEMKGSKTALVFDETVAQK